jgi:tripartite-type tricarboxylate transporter receptor subunit TctC
MRFAVAAVLAAILAIPVQAQTWPTRPITLIVPFPAGGGTDAFARPLAQVLGTQLGQQLLIDNRGGAGGTVGASAAAKMAPDGYGFFVGAAHHAIAPSIYKTLDYNIETDFEPVAMLAQPPQVIVANPQKIAANTLPELLAYLRANPGKANYGSAGAGTTHHLAGELFKLVTRTDLVHVPYSGAGPALRDLIGGQIDLMFDGLGSSAGHIQGGRVKLIAVAAPKRASAFPDAPTAAEGGVAGYEVSTWYALWAPKGTPVPIVDRMAAEVRTAFTKQELQQVWARNGSDIPTMTRAEFGRYVGTQVKAWGQVVKDANVKLD